MDVRGGLACRHGVWFSSAAGGAYGPAAIHCPSLVPSPSGGGAHRPLTAPVASLSLLGLSFPLNFPFLALSLGGLCQRSP